MKTADALDRENRPAAQQSGRHFQNREIIGIRRVWRGLGDRFRLPSRLEPDPGAAPRAGDILGMKTTVGRIGVLALAIGAGREIGHRGPLAVKWRGNLNAKPRAAASASAEGKTRAAVAGIVKLGDAGRTDS